ncbi:MAG: hypothetical protein PHH75_03190 [Candidatus Omnitrophica bacterium]|nr:hypothetical protein [Candidatus Omnitrophota bacterium]MDD5574162.1 hypothetical protein [Candidatus Omnitrophota bacterium]
MPKVKKGSRLVCVPCGREVVVDDCGISRQTIWCCGKPMAGKKSGRKKAKRAAGKKK